MSRIKKLLRENIKSFKPYTSARSEHAMDKNSQQIFLDANENAFGSMSAEMLNRYPDPLQKKLKEKLAETKNTKPAQIFIGNGSDEPIDLLYRAFCNPGIDNVVAISPSYGMYEVGARLNDVEFRTALLNENFTLSLSNIIEKQDDKTKLTFVCHPNNPSGNCFERAEIEALIEKTAGIVIVDEAYIDFNERKSVLNLIKKYENLVVLQTFSKAWGMAGLRLGMAFANEETIGILTAIKPPYNVGALQQKEAIKALEKSTQKAEIVENILAQKKELIEALKKNTNVVSVFPSDANFLLVKFKDAKQAYDMLHKKDILVRDRSMEPLCENCLRITVGTKAENERLLNALV